MRRFFKHHYIYKIGKWLNNNYKSFLLFLLLTSFFLCMVLFNNYKVKDVIVFINYHLNEISELSTILRNTVYTVAIIVGGLWWYYAFIKGRLFHSRLIIKISLKGVVGINNEIAIVNFNLRNIGKSRFMINSGSANFYYGFLKDNKVEYIHLEEMKNLLLLYNKDGIPAWIEPEDEANIDICLSLNIIQKEIGQICQSNLLLRIDSIFSMGKGSSHKENTILTYPIRRE